MLKAPKKVGIEGTQINIIKALYNEPIVNIVLNGKKLKAFFCFLLFFLVNPGV
jgi:hypothetical protein